MYKKRKGKLYKKLALLMSLTIMGATINPTVSISAKQVGIDNEFTNLQNLESNVELIENELEKSGTDVETELEKQ